MALNDIKKKKSAPKHPRQSLRSLSTHQLTLKPFLARQGIGPHSNLDAFLP